MSSDKVLTDGTTCLRDKHFDFLFMLLYKKASVIQKMFLLIKRVLFMIQIHDFVQSLARNSIPLWFEKNYDVNLTLSN